MKQTLLHQIIQSNFERYASNPAIEEELRIISYVDLNSHQSKIATVLKSMDYSENYVVGLYLNSSIEYVISMLGSMTAGKIFIPLNPHFPDIRTLSIIKKTKPSIFITKKDYEEQLLHLFQKYGQNNPVKFIITIDENYKFKTISIENVVLSIENIDSSLSADQPTIHPEDPCYIITTSGSTGEPKAILCTHEGLSHYINWEITEFNIASHFRTSQLSPVTFDVSLRDILVPLATGGTLCIPTEETKQNPSKLYQWFQTQQISLTHIVPTLFRLLTKTTLELKNDKEGFPFLKYALIAGEVLYGNDINNWRDVAGNSTLLVNIYGPSETTLAKLYHKIDNRKYRPEEIIPLGSPLPDTRISIMSDDNIRTRDEFGEICIETPYRSKGYYNDPELTNKSFIQDPTVTNSDCIIYKTGDLGKFLPDGLVQFVGRKDGQIKLYGKRIELGEIEVTLSQHESVKQSVISIKKDQMGTDRLVAYIVLVDGKEPSVETLRGHLSLHLPDYMIPSIFEFLDKIPTTHSGKIDRNALPEPSNLRPRLKQNYVIPKSTLEIELSQIWCQILQIDRVGILDNFFDIGGNSILCAQVIANLKNKLNLDVPIVKLFQYPTICDLATFLSEESDKDQGNRSIIHRANQRRAIYAKRKENPRGS